MRPILASLGVLATCLLVGAGARAGDDKKAIDRAIDELQGDWRVVELEAGGKTEKPDADKLAVSFSANNATMKADGRTVDFKFKVDPAKDPRHIDFTAETAGEKNAIGIYKLEKDRLTMCVVLDENRDRPKAFASASDPPTIVVVLQKLK